MPFEFVDIVVLLLIIQSTHALRVIALRTSYICMLHLHRVKIIISKLV
jgi:hypothetical protein